MAYKILVNDTNQEVKVAILERAGDDPGNNGPQSSEVTIAPGAKHTFQYGGPYLNGILVAVGTRGSALDDLLNTNDTVTLSGNLSMTGSNS